jgi:hypothetical protein
MRGLQAIVCATSALFLLGGCGDGAKPAGPAAPGGMPELAELVRNAQTWATRAETILGTPWAPRLQFKERLYGRIQALRSFAQEGAAAVHAGGTPPERLLARGRVLVNQAPGFDEALHLLESVAATIGNLLGSQNLTEMHMHPLETRGEAPFRLRIADLEKQVKLVFSHLDQALTAILERGPDAATHQNIATNNLSSALDTGMKLMEEVKQASALAKGATERQELLEKRIAWADAILAKAAPASIKDGPESLEAARAVARGLPPETDAVIEGLRNAQPDAPAKAAAIAARVDVVVDRLSRAFLEAGRKAGVPDPK